MATVPSTPRTNFITLGAPGSGPFNVGFRLFEADAITVYINGVKTTSFTLSADFSLGYDDSATITLGASQIIGTTIQIDGTMVADREEDYANPDPGLTRKLNTELGRLWASVSELWQQSRRSVRALSDIEPDDGVTAVDLSNLATYAAEAEAARDEVVAIEATIPTWQGAWVTATAYEFADLVQQSGSTYICIIGHTSGVFNTDLAALRWEIFAQKGTAGAGIGDVVAANNGSEYTATASTFRSNLGLAIGSAIQAFNQLLLAIAGLASNGIIVRTSGSTSVVRTIAGTANQIAVTNGDGVSGNPTLSAVIASQAEAEAGADTTKLMTAQRVSQAIAALNKGARVLLASKTASASAQLDFTEFNNAVYRYYVLEFENVKPATDAVTLWARLSSNGGVSYDAGASDYQFTGLTVAAGSAAGSFGVAGASRIELTYGSDNGNAAAERGATGEVKIYHAGDAAQQTRLMFDLILDNASSAIATARGVGVRRADQDTDAIRILYSSGNIATGTVRLYGIRE